MVMLDLLHKFELGVWKAVFTHLMCILHAVGGGALSTLNQQCVLFFSDISHNPDGKIDITKCLPLDETQFGNSATMLWRWKNLLPVTLKICFRYVAQYHEVRYSPSCSLYLVCPCCFWRPTMWTRWQDCVRPLIWACDMAWHCQAATSHRVNTSWAGHINDKAGACSSPLQINHMP